nr:MAG TPA: transmembrane protein [Siphoviridae sp. ctoD011]DAU88669.1 MAG TPA: transmembrane protein [Caudoviricetes sp.]
MCIYHFSSLLSYCWHFVHICYVTLLFNNCQHLFQ